MGSDRFGASCMKNADRAGYPSCMNTIEREKQYIRKLRPAAARGDLLAWNNIAAAYRILENFPLSARWYRKTAEAGNGNAMVDWGYCLQHAIGI